MALKPINPRLRNISNGVAKVQINVAPGDEIEVPQDVADQLSLARAPFSEVGSAPPAPKVTEAIPVGEADEAPPEAVAPKKRAPAKRARKATKKS